MMKSAIRLIVCVAVVLSIMSSHRSTDAYDEITHQALGEEAARASLHLQRALRDDLGYRLTPAPQWSDGSRALNAAEWIGAGARAEDEPGRRSLRHFHNPMLPWSSAGLRMGPFSTTSSVLWAQDPQQDSLGTLGGTWSWNVGRDAYLAALTAETPAEREMRLARTLRVIGHMTHLVQDASVPAHVRNDPHPSFELGSFRIPIDPDPYEETVLRLRQNRDGRFDQFLALRITPAPSVFRPTDDELAPVPIAALIDTQDLRRGGVVRSAFDPVDVGIAEFTNPNYLSGDTIFKGFTLPRQSQLGVPFFDVQAGKFRRYWPKVGAFGPEVAHFVAEGALYESLSAVMPDPPGVAWVLDDLVAQDYAADLIPRAVGYSTALIDYFFRGRLDVDIVDNAAGGEPSHLRIVGTNASDEPLVNGALLLYADDANGRRSPLEPVSGSATDALVRDVGPNGELLSPWFKATGEPERFVAVYRGALGDEPATPAPGAVIGKVLGGVRVEHIVADRDQWTIRTPARVHTLPLSTNEFAEVRWGAGSDVLVAMTWFGQDLPNRFASFAVQRQPGSMDLVTDADTGLLTLTPLAEAEFPFQVPLGTTVTFDQVIHYRQQLARVNPFNVRWRWVGPGGRDYDASGNSDAASPAIEVVRERPFSFHDQFDLVLDADHNLQFNALGASRYVWDVMAFTANETGRLLALVQVQVFAPRQTESIEYLGLDIMTGDLQEHATAFIQPFVPVDTGPIWALVDVGAARVLASTAGAAFSIVSEVRAEAPPFASPSYVRVGPFVPMSAPGVWVKAVDHFEGGDLRGVISERLWSLLPVNVEVPADSGMEVRAVVESRVGVETLTADGLRRGDLAGALPVSTALKVKEKVRHLPYLEVNPGQLDGLQVITLDGVAPAPATIFDMRAWGPGGTPRLALLALESEEAGGVTHMLAWDHAAGRATPVAQLAPGAHGLTAATSSSALVYSFVGPNVDPGGFIVRLDEIRPAIEFLGEDMGSFTLLDPSYLYNAEDEKFYRLTPPLRRTALPAKLAGPGEVSGDFHAIRLP